VIDYYNLSNGLNCPHTRLIFPRRFCRIQSTSCEQKRWDAVIYGAGPDMLMTLALGHPVTVHDRSEKPRETRAMWQGLAFVKRACETIWGLDLSPIEGRGGKSMEQYFDEQIFQLPDPVWNFVRFYGKYAQLDHIRVKSCWGREPDFRDMIMYGSAVVECR